MPTDAQALSALYRGGPHNEKPEKLRAHRCQGNTSISKGLI
jgi:hypothetical protein